MLRSLASLALLFLLVCPAFATTFVVPEQFIEGIDEPIPLGEIGEICVSAIKEKPANLVASSYSWKLWEYDARTGKLLDKKFRPFKDSDKEGIIFGAGIQKKKLKVVCICTHLYVVRDKDGKPGDVATRTSILVGDVVIGGEPEPPVPPPPVPPPPPPPPPDPVLPDGKYKMARFTYDTVNQKVLISDKRRDCALALAKAHRAVAAAIAAGTLKSVKDVLKLTKEKNDLALGKDNIRAWEDYSDALEDKLYSLHKSNKLTVADYSDIWKEIADGLEAVDKKTSKESKAK